MTISMFHLLLQMSFLGLPNIFINKALTLDEDIFVYIEQQIADNLLYTKSVTNTFTKLYSKMASTTRYLARASSNTSRISSKGYPPFRNVFITETFEEGVRDPRFYNFKLQVQRSFWFHMIFRLFQMDPDAKKKQECRRIGMKIFYIYNNDSTTIVKCGSWPQWNQVESTWGVMCPI